MLVVNRGRRLFRLDADTHRNLGSRGIVQLGVENLPAVGIFDVPIIGLSTRGNLLAALYRALAVAIATIIAPRIASHHRARHRTAGRRDVSPRGGLR